MHQQPAGKSSPVGAFALKFYAMLVPALTLLGMPTLYNNALRQFGEAHLAWFPSALICCAIAPIFYIYICSARLYAPRSLWLSLLAVIDTPLYVLVTSLVLNQADMGALSWDGLIELGGALLGMCFAAALTRELQLGERVPMVFSTMLIAVAPVLIVTYLLLPGQSEAVVFGGAIAFNSWAYFKLFSNRDPAPADEHNLALHVPTEPTKQPLLAAEFLWSALAFTSIGLVMLYLAARLLH
ncbi:MAG: hypothetical protein IT461_06005 [Planctomycetes bacterium]|nr:hypothetical protein [Planctomycetota bacterium]